MDRLTWADRCLRLLARHYCTNLITVVLPYEPKPGEPPPQNPNLALVVHGLGRTIGAGPDLGSAIEQAIGQLTDDELLAELAALVVEPESVRVQLVHEGNGSCTVHRWAVYAIAQVMPCCNRPTQRTARACVDCARHEEIVEH